MDLAGSFMPEDEAAADEMMQTRLQKYFNEQFTTEQHNFLTLGQFWKCKVTTGKNRLDTCYQYEIKD